MEFNLNILWPEIALFLTTCCVMILGQSRHKESRDLAPWLCAIGLVVAGIVAWWHRDLTVNTSLPHLPFYGKLAVSVVGLVLLPLMAGVADRELEAGAGHGKPFEALRSTRGEFYSFFLFSLTGLMLCSSATDLIFLFLALELTSLPTYVMVALSTSRNRSMEAGVKYFFLGALGAAVFLYGFAMIYGGTGSTHFSNIAQSVAAGGLNNLTLLGVVLAVLGVCFKIAAVPMHFYTPDVYQGAAASVSGMLAFVPKAAGFFAIILLCSLVGWGYSYDVVVPHWMYGTAAHQLDGGQWVITMHDSLPQALRTALWVIAAVTMTVGNVLAILQSSTKRLLAYSSIAHSGYMLVGVIAGPGGENAPFTRNGIAAVLFYLVAYGIMTVGAFAVVASLEKRSSDGTVDEADDIDDLRGLIGTRPLLGWTLVLSSVGLLGLPPLLGFMGKIPLFTAGVGAGEYALVIVLGINSAIAAYYYLRLAYVAFIEPAETLPSAPKVDVSPFWTARRLAGVASILGVVVLAFFAGALGSLASTGGAYMPVASPAVVAPGQAAVAAPAGEVAIEH